MIAIDCTDSNGKADQLQLNRGGCAELTTMVPYCRLSNFMASSLVLPNRVIRRSKVGLYTTVLSGASFNFIGGSSVLRMLGGFKKGTPGH